MSRAGAPRGGAVARAGTAVSKAVLQTVGLYRFLRRRVDPGELEQVVRHRLAEREKNFLRMVRDGILANPANPVGTLMRLAKVTFEDVETAVGRDGIETTLEQLRRKGVFISLDELKGRRVMVRDGREIDFRFADLYRPRLAGQFGVASGGSSGNATKVTLGFGYLEQHTVNLALSFMLAAGVDTPLILWFPVYPSAAGLLNSLMLSRAGMPPYRWFAQSRATSRSQALTNRATLLLARVYGHPLPHPREARADAPGPVLESVLATLARRGRCIVQTYVSSAVRLCRAAIDRGARLDGLTVLCASEPITAPRRRLMEASGAKVVPLYWITEVGLVGVACAQGCPGTDEVHVYQDALAVICDEGSGGTGSGSLYFTPLLDTFPSAYLNLEVGDRARLSSRPCGCALGRAGMLQRIAGIRSADRITVEGVTMSAAELTDVVERVLPQRHGGAPGDYQFVEQWSPTGARAVVRVAPRVGAVDEEAVRRTVLDALIRSHSVQGKLLEQTDAFRVIRQPPHVTEAGKILPVAVIAHPHER